MSREETIKYLNLDSLEPKEDSSNEVVFEIDQKQYAKIFTLLDRNESDWIEDSEEVNNSDEGRMLSKYYSKSGELTLDADLDNDHYTITIKDTEDKD